MRGLPIASMALLLAGCSSFQTVKLGSDGKIPPKGGIPMILPKPEFVVKKVEGSDDQYQVAVAYVADPNQRYAVRLSSTPLAQIDLALALNENGSLTSTSGGVKDQIAPTALALFKVASSAAVAFGTGGALSLDAPTDLADCLKPSDNPKPITGARTKCIIQQLDASAVACTTPIRGAITGRLEPYIGEENLDRDGASTSLFARDEAEAACLTAAAAEVKRLLATPAVAPDDLKKDFTTAFDAANAPSPPTLVTATIVRDAIVKSVGAAISVGDAAQLRRIAYLCEDVSAFVAALAGDPKPLDAIPHLGMDAQTGLTDALGRLGKALGKGAEGVTASDAQRLSAVLASQTLTPVAASVVNFTRVRVIGVLVTEQKVLDGATDLTTSAWRSRYITSLQKELPLLEKTLIKARMTSSASAAKAEKDVIDKKREIATVGGVRSEFERLLAFEQRLDTLPSATATQPVSPAGEYEKISQEAAALETAVNTAIAATLTGDAKAKPPAPLPLHTPWVSADCIDRSANERWRSTIGADAPEFVVVLRREDGTTIEPAAKEAFLCGA